MTTITPGARRFMTQRGLDPKTIDKKHLRIFDANRNGEIDRREAEMITTIADANRDGMVSASEAKSFRKLLATPPRPQMRSAGMGVRPSEFFRKGFNGKRPDWKALGKRIDQASDADLAGLIAEQSRTGGNMQWMPSAEVFYRTLPHASAKGRSRFAEQAFKAFRRGGSARNAQALGAAMASDPAIFRQYLGKLSEAELAKVTSSVGRFAWWTGKSAGGGDVMVNPPRGEHAAVDGYWFDDDMVERMLEHAKTPADKQRVRAAIRRNINSYKSGAEPFKNFVPRQGFAILAKNGARWRASRLGAPFHFMRAVIEANAYPKILRNKAVRGLERLLR